MVSLTLLLVTLFQTAKNDGTLKLASYTNQFAFTVFFMTQVRVILEGQMTHALQWQGSERVGNLS